MTLNFIQFAVLVSGCLKGLVFFFTQIAPPGSLRGTLGRFRFFPKIRGVGSAVYDTPRNVDSAVYHTLRNVNSAVYLTLLKGDSTVHLTPRRL